MFFEKVRTVDVTNDELITFKDFILDAIKEDPKEFIEANNYRGSEHFSRDESIFVNNEWRRIGTFPAVFFGFKFKKVKNCNNNSNFDFVKRVFNLTDISEVAIILISKGVNDGMLVTPHIDIIEREYCLNFPVWNFENSHTLFYKRIDFTRNSKIFLPTEIELEHEVQYEPKTVYKINTQVPHSIRLNDPSLTEPRIVLSYAISN